MNKAKQYKVLVIDDEPDIRSILEDILEDEGFLVESAIDADDGHAKFLAFQPDLVLLDIWMPNETSNDGNEGIRLLKQWKDSNILSQPVIMISGHGNIETAVEAVKFGAYDFLEKPLSTSTLLLTVHRALEAQKLKYENTNLRLETEQQRELIGDSSVITEIRRQISLLGPTDGWVFVSGEVGTGKSVVARSLHDCLALKPMKNLKLAVLKKQIKAPYILTKYSTLTLLPKENF